VIVDDKGVPVGTVEDGDAVVLFNFRADRMVEISKAFEYADFDIFDRERYPKVRAPTGIAVFPAEASVCYKYEGGQGLHGPCFICRGVHWTACASPACLRCRYRTLPVYIYIHLRVKLEEKLEVATVCSERSPKVLWSWIECRLHQKS